MAGEDEFESISPRKKEGIRKRMMALYEYLETLAYNTDEKDIAKDKWVEALVFGKLGMMFVKDGLEIKTPKKYQIEILNVPVITIERGDEYRKIDRKYYNTTHNHIWHAIEDKLKFSTDAERRYAFKLLGEYLKTHEKERQIVWSMYILPLLMIAGETHGLQPKITVEKETDKSLPDLWGVFDEWADKDERLVEAIELISLVWGEDKVEEVMKILLTEENKRREMEDKIKTDDPRVAKAGRIINHFTLSGGENIVPLLTDKALSLLASDKWLILDVTHFYQEIYKIEHTRVNGREVTETDYNLELYRLFKKYLSKVAVRIGSKYIIPEELGEEILEMVEKHAKEEFVASYMVEHPKKLSEIIDEINKVLREYKIYKNIENDPISAILKEKVSLEEIIDVVYKRKGEINVLKLRGGEVIESIIDGAHRDMKESITSPILEVRIKVKSKKEHSLSLIYVRDKDGKYVLYDQIDYYGAGYTIAKIIKETIKEELKAKIEKYPQIGEREGKIVPASKYAFRYNDNIKVWLNFTELFGKINEEAIDTEKYNTLVRNLMKLLRVLFEEMGESMEDYFGWEEGECSAIAEEGRELNVE